MKNFCAGLFCLLWITGCSPVLTDSPSVTGKPTIVVSVPTLFYSRSDFDVSMAITATQTELAVGDSFTVTVTITKTGKLGADKPGCALYGWLDRDKTHSNLSLPEPLYGSVTEKRIPRGADMTCIYTLRALRPGTIWLEGHYHGEILIGVSHAGGGPVGEWVGKDSPLLEIHIK
jgi:hypothetical protein